MTYVNRDKIRPSPKIDQQIFPHRCLKNPAAGAFKFSNETLPIFEFPTVSAGLPTPSYSVESASAITYFVALSK
jgi:hypothetical protein